MPHLPNWTCITVHKEALETIIDAAIPNKAQNIAVKRQINAEVNELMNRIAGGWLDDTLQSQQPNPPSPAGTVLCGDDGRIIGVSDGSKVLRVETPEEPATCGNDLRFVNS